MRLVYGAQICAVREVVPLPGRTLGITVYMHAIRNRIDINYPSHS